MVPTPLRRHDDSSIASEQRRVNLEVFHGMPLALIEVMPGKVVMFDCGTDCIAFYENQRHQSLARAIAEIKEYEFAGGYDASRQRDGHFYFIPHDTVVGSDVAATAGMRSEDDLFGGVVPHWFLATKAIVHNLPGPAATRPEGWRPGMLDAVPDSVLPGYSAFSRTDAYDSGLRLLKSGTVRVKDVFAAGGTGQVVVRTAEELSKAIDVLMAARSSYAVVVEANLEDVTTYSVGRCYIHGITLSYWGTQRTTKDNNGGVAYGGSDLHVIRGGLNEVVSKVPTSQAKAAVEAALVFDAAVLRHYPGMFASRRNYDVGQGHDDQGRFRCGVIDQSWRIGGTSGVEVAAARIFKERPDLNFVKGSSFNVYGPDAVPPPGAIVHFHDIDHKFGPVLMYTLIESVG